MGRAVCNDASLYLSLFRVKIFLNRHHQEFRAAESLQRFMQPYTAGYQSKLNVFAIALMVCEPLLIFPTKLLRNSSLILELLMEEMFHMEMRLN